ncbi:MAG: MFS transporter, partial [Chloroflexi bacterium]|nr:MFS transporter [Chloroflexota bacterium]
MSTETKTARTLPVHYGYVIAFTGLLVMLSAQGLGRFAYPTILPSMRDSLALTYTQTGLLATVNSLGYLVSSLFIGQLVIRFGSRWIIASGTFVTSLGMLAMSWIPNYTAAVLLQLLVGAASGCAATPIMALPSAWFAARRRGTATGIVAGGGGLGFVASGVLLPPIIAADSANGWRQAWLLLGAAVFV